MYVTPAKAGFQEITSGIQQPCYMPLFKIKSVTADQTTLSAESLLYSKPKHRKGVCGAVEKVCHSREDGNLVF